LPALPSATMPVAAPSVITMDLALVSSRMVMF